MEKIKWEQVESDFIEWDNKGHSNASQRQILDWFKKRIDFNKVKCMSCEKEVNYSEGIFTCYECSK